MKICCKRVVLAMAVFMAVEGQSTRLLAQRHSSDCWLEQRSGYFPSYEGFTGEVGMPDDVTLKREMQFLSHKYDVPYEIIAAVVYAESTALQFKPPTQPNGKNFVVHNLKE